MEQVLYRKYRPKSFSEVIGQPHIVKILKNALAYQRIAHAYLFSGPRGTGKTTVARILAKAVNCANLIILKETDPKLTKDLSKTKKINNLEPGEPCNQCSACQEINSGRALDLIEIDAASNRGIDQIRELREKISFTPARMKYKVFIIDEVHMLTREAFNALLKTLEEPPAHAIFILATTEIHRVPETIISRTQKFDFKRLKFKEITEVLKAIVAKENISIDPKALELVAINSAGSLRDAQSLLGQITTNQTKDITFEEVKTLLGVPEIAQVNKLLEFIGKNQPQEALKLVNKLTDEGYDLVQFNKALVSYLRQVVLIKIDESLAKVFDYALSSEEVKELKKISSYFPLEKLTVALKLFAASEKEIKQAILPQMPLELAIVELTTSAEDKEEFIDSSVQSDFKPESKIAILNKTNPVSTELDLTQETKEIKTEAKREKKKNTKEEKAVIEEDIEIEKTTTEGISKSRDSISLNQVLEKWSQILEEIKKYNHSLVTCLKNCQPIEIKEDNILLAAKYSFHKEKLNNAKTRLVLEKIFSEKLATQKIITRCILEEEAIGLGYKIEKPPETNQASDSDATLGQALEMFGGKVVE